MRSVTPRKKGFTGAVKALADVASFGLTMGAAILMGYFVGSYLDRKFGTSPWLMFLFLLLFMIAAFVKFFQSIQDVNSNNAKKKR